MPATLTSHQLSKPSANVAPDDPAWIESLRAAIMTELGHDIATSRQEYPDPVLAHVLFSMCGYGPREEDSAQRVLDRAVTIIRRGHCVRPPAAHRAGLDRSGWDPEDLDLESGNPEPWDLVGVARKIGKADMLPAALAAGADVEDKLAARYTAERRKANPQAAAVARNDPKVVRNAAAERHQAIKDELTGAVAANRARASRPMEG